MEAISYCEKCGEMTEAYMDWPTFEGNNFYRRKVSVMCACRRKEKAELDEHLAKKEIERKISSLKDLSLMDEKMRKASFDNYIVTEGNAKIFNVAKNFVNNYKQMKEKGQGLLIWGDVGTGKSYTAGCIANELINKHFQPVVVTSLVKIIDAVDREDYAMFLQSINSADFLIVDDFGAERGTDYALEKVYDIIDSLYRRKKSLILTTNLTMKDMKENTDIRYTRIYDRIYEMCFPVKVQGESFRKKEAVQRYNEMKELLEYGNTNT